MPAVESDHMASDARPKAPPPVRTALSPYSLWLDLSLAARNILRQRRRSAFGLGAIAMGVVALLLAGGFFEWNFEGMREATIRARIGHVQVMKPGYLDAGAADPFGYLIPEKSPEIDRIQSAPGVVTVAPRLSFSGLISIGESTVGFLAEGVDPIKERVLSGELKILQGEGLSGPDAMEVIVGRGLAENLRLAPGQQVVLLVTTRAGSPNAVEVKVKGVFRTVTKAYDDYAIRLPIRTAQSLLKAEGAHMALVLLDSTSRTDGFIARLQPGLGKNLQMVPWYQTPAADFYNKTVTLFSSQVAVLKFLIGVIIVLSISNTMMNNVRERIAEIGTCMALGDRRRTVLRRFLVEGALLGLLGGVVGLAAGVGLAHLISWIGIPMPPPPGMTTGYLAGITVTEPLALSALGLAVSTAFLAGIYPAWRASRMAIVDALRHSR